jgi:hypothetical protein
MAMSAILVGQVTEGSRAEQLNGNGLVVALPPWRFESSPGTKEFIPATPLLIRARIAFSDRSGTSHGHHKPGYMAHT